MSRPSSAANNLVVFALLAAVLGATPIACRSGSGGAAGGASAAVDAEDDAGAAQSLDPGEGWLQPIGAGAHRPGDGGGESGIADQGGGVWSIVLATFSAETHATDGQQALARMQAAAPPLREARLHSTTRGSMIVYGSYADPTDDAAQRDLKRIKEMIIDGRRPFAKAMLNPIAAGRGGKADVARSPHDLMRVREIYPEVDPLYTLQVAAWSDFDSGNLSREEARSRAEAYCRELRGKGFEAYVHHSAARIMSVVTVGLFDHTAFDPQSGLNSPELEAVKRKFPVHLVNGEELQEPVRSAPGASGPVRTRTQRPMLVKVPME
jgi:hypothetical protein